MRKSSAGLLVASLIVLALAGCSSAPPPVTVSDSDAQKMANNEAEQIKEDLQARYPDAEIPDAQLVRFVGFTEKPHAVSECLNEQGFDTRVDMGGVASKIPSEQAQAYDIARFVCDTEYPLDPKFSQPLTDDQKAVLYDYFVDTMVPCVEGLGLQVPDAPSKEKFVEQYEAGIWNPFNAITSAPSNDVYDDAVTKCPPFPDSLYGE